MKRPNFTEALNKFKPGDELEFRLDIKDQIKITEIFTRLSGSHASISRSISTSDDSGVRWEVYYDPQLNKTPKWFEKNRKFRQVLFSPFRNLVVNSEKAVERPFTSPPLGNLKRFKLRCSIRVGDWRWDFTGVNSFTDTSQAEDYINSYFKPKTDPTNFISLATTMQVIEVEIEWVGENPPTVIELETQYAEIYKVINPDYDADLYNSLSEVVTHIAPKMYKLFGQPLKKISNNPKEMNSVTYTNSIPGRTGWFVSPKADGERCFIYSDTKTIRVLSSKIENLPGESKHVIIIDAEKIGETYWAFDCLFFKSSLVSKPYAHRLKVLEDCYDELTKFIDISIKPVKKLVPELMSSQLEKILEEKLPFETDGLIFTADRANSNNHYFDGKIYKWKPADKNTIDFLIKRVPPILKGGRPFDAEAEELLILFVGSTMTNTKRYKLNHLSKVVSSIFPSKKTSYFPVPFSPSNNHECFVIKATKKEADEWVDHIGEFSWDSDISTTPYSLLPGGWKLERIRYDKDILVKRGSYFGNDIGVAMTVWQNINNPITKEMLIYPNNHKGYFATKKASKYKPATAFHSFVKGELLTNAKDPRSYAILDLAAGKGQDLPRYNSLRTSHLIAVDIDPMAIQELERRAAKSFKAITRLNTLVLDLQAPQDELYKTITKYHRTFGTVVINFAIHYLDVENIIQLASRLLVKGGILIITVYNGKSVAAKLRANEGHWKTEKWEISWDKEDKSISTKLPFADKLYTEPLVDITTLIETMEDNDFSIRTNTSFGRLLTQFEKANPTMYKQLNDDDLEHSELYQAIVGIKKT